MLTIEPPCPLCANWRCITGMTCFIARKQPVRLTVKTRSQVSSGRSTTGTAPTSEGLGGLGRADHGDREEADLGLQVSYVRSTYYFTDYGRPEWWWNYPGYWDAPYWGNWGGWYYPYAVNYSYSTGSFISELLNLEAPQGQSEKLPVLWTSYMSGLLSGSTSVNTKLAVQGVNQAFTQSTYLTNK